MISYRLYCLKDGRIVSTALFEAPDDVAAIGSARGRVSELDCELWCDGRLVAFVPAAAPDDGDKPPPP